MCVFVCGRIFFLFTFYSLSLYYRLQFQTQCSPTYLDNRVVFCVHKKNRLLCMGNNAVSFFSKAKIILINGETVRGFCDLLWFHFKMKRLYENEWHVTKYLKSMNPWALAFIFGAEFFVIVVVVQWVQFSISQGNASDAVSIRFIFLNMILQTVQSLNFLWQIHSNTFYILYLTFHVMIFFSAST